MLGRFSAKAAENWRRWRRTKRNDDGDSRHGHTDPRAYLALAVVGVVLLFATLDRVFAHWSGAFFSDVRLPLSSMPLPSAVPAPAPTVAALELSPGGAAFARWMDKNVVPEPGEEIARAGKKAKARATPAPTPSPELKGLAKATGWEFFFPVWGRFDAKGNVDAAPSLEKLADLDISLEDLVDDPERRIEKDFRTPPYLRSRVLFWLGVHAAYGNRMRVLHDRRDPSIVYGFLDFRSVYKMAGRPALGDSWAYRLESRAKKLLKARLAEAGGLAKKGSSGMSDRERDAIQSFLSKVGMASPALVAKALPNVRSQTGQRDEQIAAMRRSRDLLPHIESTLKRYDMPVALGRIPFVESSFNARAYSKVGAMGIWQFMPATARQFISKDRRLWVDPLRQTVAAAKMLRIFRSQLPDWSTTVTAYNSGAGRLARLCRKFRTSSLEGILAKEGDNGLGFAGENFYAQFLSANLVEAYRRPLFHKYLESELALGGRRSRMPMDRLRCEY